MRDREAGEKKKEGEREGCWLLCKGEREKETEGERGVFRYVKGPLEIGSKKCTNNSPLGLTAAN